MKTYLRLMLTAAVLSYAQPGYAIIECLSKSPGLKEVDNNWAGTGVLVCKEKDNGRIQREETYKDSQVVYMKFFFDNGKVSTEFAQSTVGPNTNHHGPSKEYFESGKLKAACTYVHGNSTTCRIYRENGTLERLYAGDGHYDKTELSYNEDGSLYDLQCSKYSVVKQDRDLCGFNGKVSTVKLFSGDKKRPYKTLSFDQGKVATVATVGDDGKVAAVESFASGKKNGVRIEKHANGKTKLEKRYNADGRLDGAQREFDESGQKTRDAKFTNGFMSEETLYYLNGQKKRVTIKAKNGGAVEVTSTQYHDNGKVLSIGKFLEAKETMAFGYGAYWNYDYLKPIGIHKEWREDGKLSSEQNFKDGELSGISKYYGRDGKRVIEEVAYEAGRMARRRTWHKKTGKLTLDEEYFADGSRKAHKLK